MNFCCFQPIIQQGLLDKILPTIFSSIILILLFIIGRVIDSKLKGRETRNNWYMKVILEPSIQKLDDFYTDILKSINGSINTLSKAQAGNMSYNDYLALKAKEIGNFQAIKRKFEFSFIDIVKVNCPEIADELSDNVRSIEDTVTNHLDKQIMSIVQYDLVEIEINKTKPQLLKLLYEPLKYKRVSLRKILANYFDFLG